MVLVLEADSIYYEIDGHEILKGAYINCKQGEVVGLLGRNGCGKSTMLEIIFGTRRGAHSFVRIGGKVYTDKAFRSGMLRMQP
ncbi:ATP-binding cassette domain-containing protein, partial [Prevotella sp.]